VDGQTVEEAQHNAAPLLSALRHALLTGCYRPGDVRRVCLPKPGGGQRGLGFQCRQTAEGWHAAVLLSAKAERRLRTTVREMTPPNWGQSLTACMKELSRYLPRHICGHPESGRTAAAEISRDAEGYAPAAWTGNSW
jgi:hypothetical protein